MGEINSIDELMDAIKKMDSYTLYHKAVREGTRDTVSVLKATLKIGSSSEIARIDDAINKQARGVLLAVIDALMSHEIKEATNEQRN